MSGKKPKKAKQIRDQDENASSANGGNERLRQEKTSLAVVQQNPVDVADVSTLKRVRELSHPRLMLFLSLTYVVWLGLLVWLAVSTS